MNSLVSKFRFTNKTKCRSAMAAENMQSSTFVSKLKKVIKPKCFGIKSGLYTNVKKYLFGKLQVFHVLKLALVCSV